jgi:hypothetical protein
MMGAGPPLVSPLDAKTAKRHVLANASHVPGFAGSKSEKIFGQM